MLTTAVALIAFPVISSSSFDQSMKDTVAARFKARAAFQRDRSVNGLLSGYSRRSEGVSRFFEEIRTVLGDNPDLITLADLPESVSNVENRESASLTLPKELARTLMKRWNEPVTFKGESDVPLHGCFSARVSAQDDAKDFRGLLHYASALDHFQSYRRSSSGPVWSTLRREWLGAAEIPVVLISEFRDFLTVYRAQMLVMAYDADACGSTDAQRAAQMDAEDVHDLLAAFLPQLREATRTASPPSLAGGRFVKLTGVTSPLYAGRICVVTGPEAPNSHGDMSTGVACLLHGKWSTVRIVLGKLTPLAREIDFNDVDNAGVSLELLFDRLYAITSYPDGFLNDPVNEAMARLIGLVANQYFGFRGLVRLADANRPFTRHLEHVFNNIGEFRA